ncbi:MAG: N-acetylmuramic acid 6-phosphate etherase [Gemmatimonadales bacterium]|jgi:N-acetylmuramic acid 6-phosphate etherase
MTDADFTDPRLTERRNPRTNSIDVSTSLEIVEMMNAEDRTVPDVVYGARHNIAKLIDLVVGAFTHGGRLVYVGAGTSGRLGVLDASECPPTFGSDPDMVVGLIAGGVDALRRAQEGAEDDEETARREIDRVRVTPHDVIVGIAASGATRYVVVALERAQEVGAKTALVTCADPPTQLLERCEVVIALPVGPEVLTGSTRLKAGTATKLVLNMITTGAMIRLGKAYGNLMVDLMAWSEKLHDRSERILMETCGVSRSAARDALERAGRSVKLAIVMVKRGVDADEARALLTDAGGVVRHIVGDPPPVTE